MRALATGVHYAHGVQRPDHGQLVHKDIKPSNVLLDSANRLSRAVDFNPRLADFGLAAETGGGTPAYMAPEQFDAAARLTPRTDVYGLGAALCDLLTGSAPDWGRTLYDPPPQMVRAKWTVLKRPGSPAQHRTVPALNAHPRKQSVERWLTVWIARISIAWANCRRRLKVARTAPTARGLRGGEGRAILTFPMADGQTGRVGLPVLSAVIAVVCGFEWANAAGPVDLVGGTSSTATKATCRKDWYNSAENLRTKTCRHCNLEKRWCNDYHEVAYCSSQWDKCCKSEDGEYTCKNCFQCQQGPDISGACEICVADNAHARTLSSGACETGDYTVDPNNREFGTCKFHTP